MQPTSFRVQRIWGGGWLMAENASHMSVQMMRSNPKAVITIVAGLERLDSERLGYLERMTEASDSAGTGMRAFREVQVRFLMACRRGFGVHRASARLEARHGDFRELLGSNEDEIRFAELEQNAIKSAAYTYQAFSDEEVLTVYRSARATRRCGKSMIL